MEIQYFIRILFAFFCGLLLGIERKSRQHIVGMRTLVLISVSSCVLTLISTLITLEPNIIGGDPTRIAAGIVTGIGFLGAGTIIRQGINIRGLTSAAIIWTAAALGITTGAGQFLIAGFTLILCLTSLMILEKIEYHLFPAEKSKRLTIIYSDNKIDFQTVQKEIKAAGLLQRDFNMTESLEKNKIILCFSVKAPGEFNLSDLTNKIKTTGKILEISISDE